MCDEKALREQGDRLMPRFDANGQVTALVVDFEDNTPLMLAHMNEEAIAKTIETGKAHFYSRSRQKIWCKGESSGNTLEVHEIRIDCDQDALWLSVKINGHGAACHTGQKSCFYRRIVHKDGETRLESTGAEPLFDPDTVYGN